MGRIGAHCEGQDGTTPGAASVPDPEEVKEWVKTQALFISTSLAVLETRVGGGGFMRLVFGQKNNRLAFCFLLEFTISLPPVHPSPPISLSQPVVHSTHLIFLPLTVVYTRT